MATFDLHCHPEHPSRTIEAVKVEVLGGIDDVLLTFRVRGENLRVPEWKTPSRVDELWRTTCFEAFLKLADQDHYVEFNFSPSTEWAAYSFTSYRAGMSHLIRDVDPFIERMDDGIEVDCDLGGLPNVALSLALSAVIEEIDGTKSYWALAHAPGPPDFHNPACFVATLPPPAAP